MVNQDALKWLAPEDSESCHPIIMALSDGHGSPRSFRSDRGSRFAVETAIRLAATLTVADSYQQLKQWAEHDMPRKLVSEWVERVEADIESDPFSETEKQTFGLNQTEQEHPRHLLAYGATLLLVVITEELLLLQQLGDGDILMVDDAGRVERGILKDARLMGNETTSLCMDQAWCEMQTAVFPVVEKPPAVILAATDGYANSFKNDDNFIRVGSDFLDILRTEGAGYVEQHLPNWLDECSEAGSGDDIALGLLYRRNILQTENHDGQSTPPDTP